MLPDWNYFYFYTCLLFSDAMIVSDTVLAVTFVKLLITFCFYLSFLVAPERPEVDLNNGLLLSLDCPP